MRASFASYVTGFALLAALVVLLCPQATLSKSPGENGTAVALNPVSITGGNILEAPAFNFNFDSLPGYSFDQLEEALAEKAFAMYGGAQLYSDQEPRVYLGAIAGDSDEESIFNEFGAFGSSFGQTSIFNEYGEYGGEFGRFSPFNEFAEARVVLVKNGEDVGVLTIDSAVEDSLDPRWLTLLFDINQNN